LALAVSRLATAAVGTGGLLAGLAEEGPATPPAPRAPRIGGRANPGREAAGFEGAAFGAGGGGASLDLFKGFSTSGEVSSALLLRLVARMSSSSVEEVFFCSSFSTCLAKFVCLGVKTGRGSLLDPTGVGFDIVGICGNRSFSSMFNGGTLAVGVDGRVLSSMEDRRFQ